MNELVIHSDVGVVDTRRSIDPTPGESLAPRAGSDAALARLMLWTIGIVFAVLFLLAATVRLVALLKRPRAAARK